MRPIIVYNFRKFLDAGMDENDFMVLTDFITTYTLENAMLPGQIEQHTIIVDVRGVALWELPV